ncbi:MAG: hypothetical protein C0481_05280 [Phenylobacterium sp.]|uniref:hypothetical protein n=1 Tax=Phenylobacterium sp. TaxID=1871053 RepID=UPI0025D4B9EC|nr:hypothetical protein [Phenylobacterium sp.]MBA4011260.1 hypothetical protein [Phenylobacterium sp.]
MTPDQSDQDLKALWRNQQMETGPMSIEQIHARAFQSRIQVRNLVEYAASVLVLALFGFYAVYFPHPMMKLGAVMIMAGTAVMAWQLHRRASARILPPEAAAGASLAFHRAELVRQRDALRSAFWWYIAPFAPGMMVFVAGMAQARAGASLGHLAPLAALICAYLAAWFLMNRRAAKRLQAEIDDIDALMDAP